MGDANFNKNLTAAEYEAIHILQAQNPSFKKIEGKELQLFYREFEEFYLMGKKAIGPKGQSVNVIGNNLLDSISYSKWFINNYEGTRVSYEKSVHFLGASFGRLLGGVQFGFKKSNPDVDKFRENIILKASEISSTLKKIKPGLKLKYIPKRILEIYHQDPKEVHPFTAEFAQELSR